MLEKFLHIFLCLTLFIVANMTYKFGNIIIRRLLKSMKRDIEMLLLMSLTALQIILFFLECLTNIITIVTNIIIRIRIGGVSVAHMEVVTDRKFLGGTLEKLTHMNCSIIHITIYIFIITRP